MGVYAYKATSQGGAASLARGTITAESPRQAREALRARGLRVRDLTPVREQANRGGGWVWRRRMDASVTQFTSELATLLGAGIPLLQALHALTRQYTGPFQQCLLLLHDRIAAGSSLAEAMRQQPTVFDELSISLVDVGERSGTLESVLTQLAGFKQRSHQLRGRIVTALIYPAIVVAAGLGVMMFLMTFVVPKLLESLVDAGRPLPLATRITMALSNLLLHYWWLLLLGAAAGALGMAMVRRSPPLRHKSHALILRLPLLGDLIRKQTIVRIALTIATLTRSGVEFLQAVRLVGHSMPNLVFRDALLKCEQAVAAGRDIAPAIESTGAFPPMVVQIFSVGQESGRLDDMLDRLASDYDGQVNIAATRFVAVLEPALILLLAVFILFIVLAVILPYLEVGNVL